MWGPLYYSILFSDNCNRSYRHSFTLQVLYWC